jgi:twitching motility two-component system response regulator PilH
MRLELESNASDLSTVNVNQRHVTEQEKFADYLNAGVKAAQAGDRKAARRLLMSALDIDSHSENAWLWLASISEYPEELLVFLNNVLDINPENERALQWSASTKMLLSKTLVQRGIDANDNGRRDFALQCFDQALSYDTQNVTAWLWMASLSDSEERRMEYFRRVLEIDAANETATAALKAAEADSRATLFAKAATFAVCGDLKGARDVLEIVFDRWPDDKDAWVLMSHLAVSFEDKKRAVERVVELDPRNGYASACLDSLNWVASIASPFNGMEQPPEVISNFVEQQAASNEVEHIDMNDEDPLEFEAAPSTETASRSETVSQETWSKEISEKDVYLSDDFPTVDAYHMPSDVLLTVNTEPEEQRTETTATLNTTVFEPVEPNSNGQYGNSPFDSVAEPISDSFEPEVVDERQRIMVVENSPTARRLMASKLEDRGYNVLCAESALEAVELARNSRPHLALIDVGMPGIDGYSICRMLRDEPQTQEMPVVLISAKDQVFDENLAAAAGASGSIARPFGPEALMKTIAGFISNGAVPNN